MGEPARKLTAAEAGLELVRAHHDFCDQLEEYDERTAKIIRRVNERFEEVLRERLPPWVTIDEARRHTGWSRSYLRDWCREHEDTDLVRRNPHWEILRAAIGNQLKPKDGHVREVIDLSDISGSARRLARME